MKMKYTFKNVGLRYCGRDIIKVFVGGFIYQPFYRSSGRNSFSPGTWFPFDGIMYPGIPRVEWFDKTAYCHTQLTEVPEHLNRYGTSELKQISEWLATQNIEDGIESCPFEIDEWLEYKDPSVQAARDLKLDK